MDLQPRKGFFSPVLLHYIYYDILHGISLKWVWKTLFRFTDISDFLNRIRIESYRIRIRVWDPLDSEEKFPNGQQVRLSVERLRPYTSYIFRLVTPRGLISPQTSGKQRLGITRISGIRLDIKPCISFILIGHSSGANPQVNRDYE